MIEENKRKLERVIKEKEDVKWREEERVVREVRRKKEKEEDEWREKERRERRE